MRRMLTDTVPPLSLLSFTALLPRAESQRAGWSEVKSLWLEWFRRIPDAVDVVLRDMRPTFRRRMLGTSAGVF